MPDGPDSKQVDLRERLKNLSPEKRELLKLISGRTRTHGYQLVVQSLLANGVTHIFALSGVPVQELLATAVEAGIRVIGTRHQQAAVMMAIAHNYTVGRLNAVVIVSAGPAVTNVATGLLVARDNAWPVIVLGGRKQGLIEGQGSFQELDATELFQSITKWSRCIDDVAEVPCVINDAFNKAVAGRPGPVYLDIIDDVLHMRCASSNVDMPGSLTVETASPNEIEQAAEMLRNARWSAFILGKGMRWSLVHDDLVAVIEQHHIAFISSPMGRGILPDEHGLCFNRAKRQLQEEADVIVVLGARLNWTFRYGSQINPGTKVIQVDIDSEEVEKNERISLGIVADVGHFVTSLRAALHGQLDKKLHTARTFWHASLARERDKQMYLVEKWSTSDRLPMSSYRVMKTLKELLPADTILVVDGNISMMAAQHVIPGRVPFSRFTAGSNGCMGVGVPFGIGAKLGDLSRPVVVITGDMAFGVSAMEMETAVRCAVPLIVVVINKEGLSGGNIQHELYPSGHERVTMFEPDIRYEKIAEAFGAQGEYVDCPEQLRPAIERALQSDKLSCINVSVDPYEKFMSEL